MKKESAEILHIDRNQKTSFQYSPLFTNIMSRWERIAFELNTTFEEEKMYETDQHVQRAIEARYEKAGRDQRDVFESVTKLNANKIEDVLAKLELWKATICPNLETQEELSLTEQILLSAYDDLSRLLAFDKQS